MSLNKQLLEILVCPQCHGKVYFDEKLSGIPVMLVEDAQKLS